MVRTCNGRIIFGSCNGRIIFGSCNERVILLGDICLENGLRFARQEHTEMKAIYYKQSFLCRLSYDAQRLYALWIREKISP